MLAFRSVPGLLFAACLAWLLLAAAPPALADTFPVNTDQDAVDTNPGDGLCRTSLALNPCSLRAAIQEANAQPGPDTIEFDTSLPSPTTILLEASLGPLVLTGDGTTIDASSHWYDPPGGTPMPGIVITANGVDFGFELDGADNCLIRGFTIQQADIDGILIYNGAANNTIGGTGPKHHNLIAWSVERGIIVLQNAGTGNRILGNYIGMHPGIDADMFGNFHTGVYILADETEIRDNYVGNNAVAGVSVVFGRDVVIEGNTIGITDSGYDVGNDYWGITGNDTRNLLVKDNRVANNKANGIIYDGTAGGSILAPSPAPDNASTPDLTIQDTHVFSNGHFMYGGGIRLESSTDSSLVILNNVDVNNNRGALGAGIYLKGAALTARIEDSRINNNLGHSVGGVGVKGATLSIENSKIRDNRTEGGWGNAAGVAVENGGTLSLSRTTIAGNVSDFVVGGLHINEAEASLTDCAIKGNEANSSGGGIEIYKGTLVVSQTTISGNTAGGSGGGVNANDAQLELTNVTVSGNASGVDGGGFRIHSSSAALNHCTITANTADQNDSGTGNGGGIYTTLSANVRLNNSLLAGNFDKGGQAPDCGGDGSLLTHGTNLIRQRKGCSYVVADGSNITNRDPLLGPLADNGGGTRTHALLKGSPAIDAVGDCRTIDDLAVGTDQRAEARPSGLACDSGAFELQQPVVYLPVLVR